MTRSAKIRFKNYHLTLRPNYLLHSRSLLDVDNALTDWWWEGFNQIFQFTEVVFLGSSSKLHLSFLAGFTAPTQKSYFYL